MAGGDRTRKEADGCALTLLREIEYARTLHHAFAARAALFHMRLMANRVAEEMDRTFVEQGCVEATPASGMGSKPFEAAEGEK